MRRFAKAAFLLRTAAASRQVVDGVSVPPSTDSDVLLQDLAWRSDFLDQDLSWSALASLFTARDRSTLIHEEAKVTDDGKFALSPTLRACALLPVTKRVAQQRVTRWVPFLIDTGARTTHFTKNTVEELRLDCAERIEVFGQTIALRDSAGPFKHINLLGTDVLSCGDLFVDYPTRCVSFRRTEQLLPAHCWVQQRSSDGTCIGPAFAVTPTDCTVDGLKEAIMARMDVPREGGEGADLTIYEPKSIVPILKAARTLETNTEWAPYGFVVHRA